MLRGHETFVDVRHKYGFLLTQVNRVWPAGSTGICTVLLGRRFQTGEGGVVIRGSFFFSSLYYHRIFPPWKTEEPVINLREFCSDEIVFLARIDSRN